MKSQLGGRRLAGTFGAVAAGLAGAQSVDAAVIHMDVSLDIPGTRSIDLGSDGINEFNITQTFDGSLQSTPGVKIDTFAGQDGRPGMAGVINSPNGATNLAAGTLIDSNDTFFTTNFFTNLNHNNGSGNFNSSAGYIGVEFQLNGNTHYGYVGYEGFTPKTPPDPPLGHIFRIAWETEPDTGILAGASGIPEPASLVLLALGAAGIATYRRRHVA